MALNAVVLIQIYIAERTWARCKRPDSQGVVYTPSWGGEDTLAPVFFHQPFGSDGSE